MTTPISLSVLDSAYIQGFDTLSNTASSTNNLTIPGWLLTETGSGANQQYAVDNGTNNAGDAYSYGAAASTDRALGTLQSGTDIPTIGAIFTNNTGQTITSLTIAYDGEQWRKGSVGSQQDKLDFQYSLDATDLTTGTWTDANALDFVTPNFAASGGATDGNSAGSRTSLTTTISGLNIASGATFLIRWTDANLGGNDDGLAVDNFVLTPHSTQPTVTINQAEGQADPTISGPILFDVVFSEDVTGFDQSHVVLGGTANPSTVLVTPIDARHYTVAVSGMTTSGTVTAAISAGAAEGVDGFTAASTSVDHTVDFAQEVIQPTVTINQAMIQLDPTSTGPILFDVVFSQNVTGFDASDVIIGGTANPNSVTVSAIDGMRYVVSVSGMAHSGTVAASIPSGAATGVDGATAASTSVDNTVSYTDVTPPTVTINQAGGQADPASASPVFFDVAFNEDVANFTAGDVTLGGTAHPTTANVQTIDARHYIVSVSGMTASGSVTASIGAGVATDASGNGNLASTSIDNTIAFVVAPGAPTVTINQGANQPDPTGVGPIVFDVTFSEAVTGFDPGDVVIGGTAHPASKIVQVIDAAHYNVLVSGMTNSGTVTASVVASAATGVDGATAASTSTDNSVSYLFNVDVPGVTLSSIAEDSGSRLITQGELLSTASGLGPSLTAINLTKAAGGGGLVDNHNGTWSYFPALNDDTSALFVYQVTGGTTPVVTSATLDITPVNDAPVNTVPGAVEAQANSSMAIAGLSVADVDFQSGIMQTTLSVTHGTLTMASAGGALVFGSGTGTVALIGRPSQIDTTLGALNNVVYHGAHDFFGADTLMMTTDDGGSNGAGGALSDTDTVHINVNTLVTGSTGSDTVTAQPGNERIDGGPGIDTVTFGFKVTDAKISFSGGLIIVDTPTSHTVLSGFEKFVFTDGTVDNNDADPLVDDLFYYAQNPDVWNAHVDADAHYHAIGWKEGRDPDAFFSTSTYLSLYPDVKAAGVDPLISFDQSGWKAGRVPSINFDDAAYLAANPDVKAAGIDPLKHFLQYGEQEGRQPVAFDHLLASNGFDYVYYLKTYPDIAASHVDPFQQFETTGWKDGRNPNALFDTKGYLAAYADVKAAGINPLDHYNQFGWHDGRDPSGAFDTNAYLSHYPDVAAAHVNPLTHYLQFGQAEGRSAFADGHFM